MLHFNYEHAKNNPTRDKLLHSGTVCRSFGEAIRGTTVDRGAKLAHVPVQLGNTTLSDAVQCDVQRTA